jgi:AcrR family transcriptional regulator
MPQPRPLARPPVQQRSRESLERALAAGVEVIIESGWQGFTVAEVSRRAKVSVGAIYARFDSKEDLFLAAQAVGVRAVEIDDETYFGDPRWDTMDPRETVIAAVEGVGSLIRRHEGFLGGLMRRAVVDDAVSQRGSLSIHHLDESFLRTVLRHRDAIVHPEPEVCADVCFRLVFSTFSRRIVYGATFESERRISWQRLTDEMAQACALYLLGPGNRPA